MYLFLDNSKTEQNVFFVSEEGKNWQKFVFSNEDEGDLEKGFSDLLNQSQKTLSDLKGVAVRVGVGRFTATRLAITFANALALELKIPVLAVESEVPEGIVATLQKTPVGQYALAKYSAEPRLGGKN